MAELLAHLDVGDEPRRRPSTAQVGEQLGLAGEAREAVDAQRLRDPGHDEEQADARALDEVLHPVEATVAREFRDKQTRIREERGRNLAGPPLGPASHEPSAPVVASTRNGEARDEGRASRAGPSSTRGSSFATTRGSGSPPAAREELLDRRDGVRDRRRRSRLEL